MTTVRDWYDAIKAHPYHHAISFGAGAIIAAVIF
jgi:hypothetical protein